LTALVIFIVSYEVSLFVIFSTSSADDILLLLTFICSLVSDMQAVSQEELEELKVSDSFVCVKW